MLVNLACKIVAPTLFLMKLSGEDRLGPVAGLLVALTFPLGYGIYDFARRRRANMFSIVGLASVLLTGGLGLLQVDGFWFAVKEAAIPGLFSVATLLSLRTKRPLVRALFYNGQVVDVARVDAALEARGRQRHFDRLLRGASVGLALSFLLSAFLNYGLARYLLQSPSGTPEFNAELGRMHALNWPVIVLPSMAVMMFVFWRLMRGLTRLTGLPLEAIFPSAAREAEAPPRA